MGRGCGKWWRWYTSGKIWEELVYCCWRLSHFYLPLRFLFPLFLHLLATSQKCLNEMVTVYREHTQVNKAFHPSSKMILTNSARSVLMGELVLLGLSTEAVSSSLSLEECSSATLRNVHNAKVSALCWVEAHGFDSVQNFLLMPGDQG